MSLPELDFTYQTFLDKTTILYGESKTGKSTIIIDILYQLKPFVDQIIVIAPTDPQNHTYSGKTVKDRVVPLPCIHYSITDQLLKDIWARQEALTAAYMKANDKDVVESLFNRLNLRDVKCTIDDITRRRREREAEIRAQYTDQESVKTKIEEMNEDFNKLVIMIYKHYININKSSLQRMSLTKDEQFTIKYLNLNPRLVLVFDDCTEQFDRFKKHPVIQKIGFQGRWNFITTVVACHTDLNLFSAFKTNAFVSIFTEESCVHMYFGRKSTGIDKDKKRRAEDACKIAFVPIVKHQKLAIIRENKTFYKFVATRRPGFTFGCSLLWDYCEKVQNNGRLMPSDNKFASGFI